MCTVDLNGRENLFKCACMSPTFCAQGAHFWAHISALNSLEPKMKDLVLQPTPPPTSPGKSSDAEDAPCPVLIKPSTVQPCPQLAPGEQVIFRNVNQGAPFQCK